MNIKKIVGNSTRMDDGSNDTNGNQTRQIDDDWTLVRKAARRTKNPRTRKLVTEEKNARDLLTILALLSVTPLDVYETKEKGKFVIKLTNNNLEYFDSESNRRKMAQRKIRVVENFSEEDDSLVIARRVSKLLKQYTEKEIMEEIKKKKQIEVKRIGLQEVGMGLNLFLHCKSSEDAEELAGDDLVLCNLLIKKTSFQKRKQIRGRQCHKCGKMGHIMFHCTNEKACWTCGEKGHDAKDCKLSKKCILCNSTDHGALYRGCPVKSIHRKELVKIIQEEQKKKKLPIGMRGERKQTTTLASPISPELLTKSQKKRRRRNEKKRKNTQTQTSVPAQSVMEKKKTTVQPNKKIEKKTETDEKTEYTLEEKLMSVAAAAWGMSRNMPHEIYIKNYNKLLEDSGLGGLKVNYKLEERKASPKKKEEQTVSSDKKEEKKQEEKRERTTPVKQRRVTISDPKEETDDEKQEEVEVEGKRKRLRSSVAEIPKRKRVITRSTTSEEESTDMDTDSGSEDVFEASGPRFRINGPWKTNAIVEFRSKQSHADCRFEDNDFDIMHSEISRAEILEIATSKPECLDRLY